MADDNSSRKNSGSDSKQQVGSPNLSISGVPNDFSISLLQSTRKDPQILRKNIESNSINEEKNNSRDKPMIVGNNDLSTSLLQSRKKDPQILRKNIGSDSINNDNNNSINNNSNNNRRQFRSQSPGPKQIQPRPALLRTFSGSSIRDYFGQKLQRGGIKGSIFTLIIATVGAGCLALPYAMREMGIVSGAILIGIGALLAYFTYDLLLISAEYLPPRYRGYTIDTRNISYQSLSDCAMENVNSCNNPKCLGKFVQCIMLFQYFGGVVGYTTASSGLIDLVFYVFTGESYYVYITIITVFVIVLPLSFLKDVSALRFTSLMGFLCSSFLAIVIVVEYFVLCDHPEVREYDETSIGPENACFWSKDYKLPTELLWRDNWHDRIIGALIAWPLIVFTYTAHPFVLPIYVELQRPTIDRMRRVFRWGSILIVMIYYGISIFGFLLFLEKTCSNVLTNDFKQSGPAVAAALGIATSCILTQPIFVFNFRKKFCQVFWDMNSTHLSNKSHYIMSILVVICGATISLLITSIAEIFGYLGATAYPLLGYVLPTIYFYMLTPRNSYPIRKILAPIQSVIIIIVSIASLVVKILYPKDAPCYPKQTITSFHV